MLIRRLRGTERSVTASLYFVAATRLAVPTVQAQDLHGEQNDVRIQRILLRGLTMLYIEDYEGAVYTLQQGLDILPDSPSLLATMGKAQIGLGETASAEFYLQRALALDPDNPDLWRFLAETALDAGNAPAAVSALREVASLTPDELGPQLDLVRLLIRLEQYEEASEAVSKAVAVLGPNPLLLVEQADVQERLGQSEALSLTLDQLIINEPTNLGYRYRRGALYVRSGEWVRAAIAFEEILEIDPDHIEASRSLAEVLERQGRTEEASTILSALWATTAESAASMSAEEMFFRGIDASNDERELRRRLNINDRDPVALVALAALMMAGGRHAEAATLYRRHVDSNPRSLESWTRGIAAFVSAGDPQEALSFADDGLLLFPGYRPIQIELAAALIAAGLRDEARDLLNDLSTRASGEGHRDRIAALLSALEG